MLEWQRRVGENGWLEEKKKTRHRRETECANAILRIDGIPTDTVLLNLVETHCIPILTYGCEILSISNRDDRRQLRVAYNSLFRRIFQYRWCESVTALQHFLGHPTWEELVDRRRNGFLNRVRQASSRLLSYRFLL